MDSEESDRGQSQLTPACARPKRTRLAPECGYDSSRH